MEGSLIVLNNIMSSSEISVLVISCSLYKNIWDPFFHLFQKNWPDCPFDIYLGTDKYTDNYNGNSCNINILKASVEPNAGNYTARVTEFLSQINSKYVILFQDDFLIDSPVYTNEILECFDILEGTTCYNGIRLHGVGCDCGRGENKYNVNNRIHINECSQDQRYWFSWMCSMWNRKFILDNLNGVKGISAEDCERDLTNIFKRDNNKMLAIADDRESGKRVRNIIPYIGIGAINGGIVNNDNMQFLKHENIPIKVYNKNCIYDSDGGEHKFNKGNAYYMKVQNQQKDSAKGME
jgi:hypothetical protein